MEQTIRAILDVFTDNSSGNVISKDDALSPEVAGLRMFGHPLVCYGDAADPLFAEMKLPQSVGSQFMVPEEWLPGARSVISIFFPFSEEVRKSNARDRSIPSDAWFHARIEGDQFILDAAEMLAVFLEDKGLRAVIPAKDPRFHSVTEKPEDSDGWRGKTFTSNWSERHVGFVCGLGTFGLSRGLITDKGMAGRLISLITDAVLKYDRREYEDLYEYCIKCGKCAQNCPVGAISPEKGKQHLPCRLVLIESGKYYKGYYGCGKCQVNVPCENQNPSKKAGNKHNN